MEDFLQQHFYVDVLLRLCASLIGGLLLGLERENRLHYGLETSVEERRMHRRAQNGWGKGPLGGRRYET